MKNLVELKKVFKALMLSAILILPLGLSAADQPKVEDSDVVFARCEITVSGFHASGNCNKVLAAYRAFLALQ